VRARGSSRRGSLPPFEVGDAAHAPHRFEHLGDVGEVVHLDEAVPEHRPLAGLEVCAANAGASLADRDPEFVAAPAEVRPDSDTRTTDSP